MKLGLSEESAPTFRDLLVDELQKLEGHNCARYRLTIGALRRGLPLDDLFDNRKCPAPRCSCSGVLTLYSDTPGLKQK